MDWDGVSKLFACCVIAGDDPHEVQVGYPTPNVIFGESPCLPAGPRVVEEQEKAERERLQAMVKQFAKTATMGKACEWVQEDGTLVPSTFRIDRNLANFTVEVLQGDAHLEVAVIQIIDVVRDVHDPSVKHFPEHLRRLWSQRFVAVQYMEGVPDATGNTPVRSLGLLLHDIADRNQFFSSVKILRWALDSARGA
jgi:hypothetical protein